MRIALIQVKANDLKDYQKAWNHLEAKILKAAENHDLILVPECAYPSYFIHKDEGDLDTILKEGEACIDRVKEIAKENKVFIAYGYTEKVEDVLYNSALLIGRKGEEVLKKRKSFLWHFDNNWFAEGDEIAVTDTEFGRVALVICADARMPEIVRLAKLEGAELIIDLANLTATGPEISRLQNAQSAYMLSVRALENNVWLAVSDKWGVELNTITYTGRSSVFAPDGTCLKQARSDRDEIVSVEIPTDQNGKILIPEPKYKIKRRPELYEALTQETSTLPISQMLVEKVIPTEVTPYMTVGAGKIESREDYIKIVRRLVNLRSDIICMPPTTISLLDEVDQITKLLTDDTIVVASSVNQSKEMITYIISKNGVMGKFLTLHSENESSKVDFPVFETKWGKIGIIHELEALLPEWPRTLMLQGVDCLIWPNQLPYEISNKVGRTRATESRMFVVSVQARENDNAVSEIIEPNGNVIASTLKNEKIHATGAYTSFAVSRMKEFVPNTNVVKNRRPEKYRRITYEKN